MTMLPELDLRLLRVFATLARVNSFTETARIMHLTQSAISHGMKRLETQLGCPLLYKKGKATHLTPEGRMLLGHAVRLLEGLDRAVESISGRGADSPRKLSVTFSASIAHLILAPVLRELRESYRKMSVVVRMEDTLNAIKAIEEGESDLAVVVEDLQGRALTAHPLFEDALSFMVSPQHAWAKGKKITAKEMAAEHFLLYQRHSVTFNRVEDFFLRAGVQLASYVEIPDIEIMKHLAKLGLGVAIMAPWTARRELEEGSLVSLPLPKFSVKRRWVVIHQAHRDLRAAEHTFIGLCRMACLNATLSGRYPEADAKAG